MIDEATLILERARNAGLYESAVGYHLASKVSVMNYVRIADEICHRLPRGTVLDWGCGYGQMSFLLQRRGLQVESYDVGDSPSLAQSPVFPEVTVSRTSEKVQLPFADNSFDGALSCGVLEHVPDDAASLRELARVVRPGGLLFIYNLPQRTSYKEFLLERMHIGYTHERKYTLARATALLERTGWRVMSRCRAGMLPQNLTPAPWLRGFYSRSARLVLLADGVLSHVPLLNNLAEALELVATKPRR
jgi:ubiquinone/menaquinone biosynthesis C-methylase UbiE